MALLKQTRRDTCLIVHLRNPVGNALSSQLQHELAATWREFEQDHALEVAILYGEDGVFSVGHDLEELRTSTNPDVLAPEVSMLPLHLRKPVLAAIEGPCLGLGLELALSCDMRIAARGSRFSLSDSQLGIPHPLAAVLLPRLTFAGVGLELLETLRSFDETEMLRCRLVNKVVDEGMALTAAIDTAEAIVSRLVSHKAFRKQELLRLSGLPLAHIMTLAREPL